MTDEQLVEIERLAEAATPGSWKSGWSWQDAINGGKSAWSEGPVHVGDTLSQVAPQAIADAAFIAAARDAVPALVAEVRRLQDDATRLGHYRQFVATLSAILRVPDDSMILPHAQEMTAEITRLRAEAADLRRQVEHANRWRDSAILEANEARAEAAELRRQLAAAQETIAALRLRLSLDNPAYRPAPGEGE